MKSLMAFLIILSTQSMASEEVRCIGERAVQSGTSNLLADADISFSLDRSKKEITNVVGHIFVKSLVEEDQSISTNNAYMGFFKTDSLSANPDYRAIKYKGWVQFKDLNAEHTAGVESGMWGNLVMDLTKKTEFSASYIFQAGDHMGGTVLFQCYSNAK